MKFTYFLANKPLWGELLLLKVSNSPDVHLTNSERRKDGYIKETMFTIQYPEKKAITLDISTDISTLHIINFL